MNYIMAFLFSGFVCLIAQLIYDRLVDIFHAGALIPITSFGHSLMHGAMAATKEYGVFGIAMGMFDLTAAGISAAILFGFLVAILFKPKS